MNKDQLFNVKVWTICWFNGIVGLLEFNIIAMDSMPTFVCILRSGNRWLLPNIEVQWTDTQTNDGLFTDISHAITACFHCQECQHYYCKYKINLESQDTRFHLCTMKTFTGRLFLYMKLKRQLYWAIWCKLPRKDNLIKLPKRLCWF